MSSVQGRVFPQAGTLGAVACVAVCADVFGLLSAVEWTPPPGQDIVPKHLPTSPADQHAVPGRPLTPPIDWLQVPLFHVVPDPSEGPSPSAASVVVPVPQDEAAIAVAGYGPGAEVAWRWESLSAVNEDEASNASMNGAFDEQNQPSPERQSDESSAADSPAAENSARWHTLSQVLQADSGGRLRSVGPLINLPDQVGDYRLSVQLGAATQFLQLQVIDIGDQSIPSLTVDDSSSLRRAASSGTAVMLRLPAAPPADQRLEQWLELPQASGPDQWWGWHGTWPDQPSLVPAAIQHVRPSATPADFLIELLRLEPTSLPAQLFVSPDISLVRHGEGRRRFADFLWAVRARYEAFGARGCLVLVLPPLPVAAAIRPAARMARQLWRERALHLGWTVVDPEEILGTAAYALPNGAWATEPVGTDRQALVALIQRVHAGPVPPTTLQVVGGTRLLAPDQSADIAWEARGPVLEGMWYVDDQLAFVDPATQRYCLWQPVPANATDAATLVRGTWGEVAITAGPITSDIEIPSIGEISSDLAVDAAIWRLAPLTAENADPLSAHAPRPVIPVSLTDPKSRRVYGRNGTSLLPVGGGPLPGHLAWLVWHPPASGQLQQGEEYRALWALRQRRDTELASAGLAVVLTDDLSQKRREELTRVAWGLGYVVVQQSAMESSATLDVRGQRDVVPYDLPPARYDDQDYRLEVRQQLRQAPQRDLDADNRGTFQATLLDSTMRLADRAWDLSPDGTPRLWLDMPRSGCDQMWSGVTGAGRFVVRHGWPPMQKLDAAGRDQDGAWWVPTVTRPAAGFARRWSLLRTASGTAPLTEPALYCHASGWPGQPERPTRNRWQVWAQPPQFGTIHWWPNQDELAFLDRLLLVWNRRLDEVASRAARVVYLDAEATPAMRRLVQYAGWHVQTSSMVASTTATK